MGHTLARPPDPTGPGVCRPKQELMAGAPSQSSLRVQGLESSPVPTGSSMLASVPLWEPGYLWSLPISG